MIERTTAEAAAAAQQISAMGGDYGEPVDAVMALCRELTVADFRLLGCYWLAVANANDRQLDAVWKLSGAEPMARFLPVSPHIAAVLRAGGDLLVEGLDGDITIVRLALACFDQGDLPVTAARLVEVLCWEEQPS